MNNVEFIKKALETSQDLKINDLRIGISYTAVELSDGSCGLASNMVSNYGCCSIMKNAGEFSGLSVEEYINGFEETSTLNTSIGLAIINAILNKNCENSLKGDIIEHMKLDENSRVAMVGNFKPVVKRIKEKKAELFVFEKNCSETDQLLPEEEMKTIIPSCSHLIITSTTLINKTLDSVLKYKNDKTMAAMLGPSTTFFTEYFRNAGISLLSGVKIIDNEGVKRTVSQAGGTRQFMKHCQKITLEI